MKKILASLLATYALTNGQTVPPPPPVDVIPIPALISAATSTSAPQAPATSSAATSTAAPQTTAATPPAATVGIITPPLVPQAPATPLTTAAAVTPATTASVSSPATTVGVNTPQVPLPVVIPPNAPLTTASAQTPATPLTTAAAPPAAPVTTAGASGTTTPPVIIPTTPAPTINPFCTPGLATMAQHAMHGNFGQGEVSCTSYTGPGSTARDIMGQLDCVDGGCCMCSEISCGLQPGMPCDQIQFGDFSAAGAQNIQVKGSMAWNMGSFGNWQQGAQINCGGQQSCRAARIVGELVGEMQCSGWYGCNDANIVLNDPAPQFNLQCDGEGGCAGANIEINIRNCASFVELGHFQFNGNMAAAGASITVNNYCPNAVMIEHLDCQHQGSCQGTQFRFNGAVQIQNCEIFGAAQLPPQCFGAGFAGFGGFPQFNPLPQPGFGFPQIPQQPLPQPPVQQPQQPVTPTNPAPQQPVTPPQTPPQQPPVTPPQTPPQTPSQPVTPTNPVPPQQPVPQQPTPGFGQQPGFGGPQQPGFAMGFGTITGFGGQCEFAGQCSGPQTINLQSNRFELACAETGSCSRLALTLNAPAGGLVDTIEGFRFEAPFAAQGATITINSQMAGFYGNPIEIGHILCDVAQACAGVSINAPGIDLSNLHIECREQGACTGGSINGMSFDMLAANQGNFQQGQFGGFGFPQQQYPGFPQYGAPQQPQQPGFPQQPGMGQPQQPQQPQMPQYQYPPMGYPYQI